MITLNKTSIALLKGYSPLHSLEAVKDFNPESRRQGLSIQAELMKFGYIIPKSDLDLLHYIPSNSLKRVMKEVQLFLSEMYSSDNYKPFYPNFPEESLLLSDEQLYFNAIIHYWSEGQFSPEYERTLPHLIETNRVYRPLKEVPNNDFASIFTNLVSINSSLTSQDKEILEYFLGNYPLSQLKVSEVPFKETLIILADWGVDVKLKTVTDVLRLAYYMSGGDYSLSPLPNKYVYSRSYWSGTTKSLNPERLKHNFKKFKRSERKRILSLLENTNCDVKEAKVHIERWIKLGEYLHPGDYTNTYPKAFKMFNTLRNEKVSSWYGDVNKAFNKSFSEGLIKLSERPGEFLRKLDYLVRESKVKDLEMVLAVLSNSSKASAKVLVETLFHFEKRNQNLSRQVYIKGARRPVTLPTLPPLSDELINRIKDSIKSALRTKFSENPNLGKVYLDPMLKNIPIPSNMRNVSVGDKPTIRGMRLPFNGDFVRSYVHWNDPNGRIDIDLSSTIFHKDGSYKTVSFSGLRLGDFGEKPVIYHSGDVRYRVGSNAEYVDFDIQRLVEKGYHYAVVDVRDFEGRGLAALKAKAGILSINQPNSYISWDSKSLEQAFLISTPSIGVITVMLDFTTKECIIVDMDVNGIASRGTEKYLRELVDNYIKPPVFSVYDLLQLHINNGDSQVETLEEADTQFLFDDFSKSYELIFKYI